MKKSFKSLVALCAIFSLSTGLALAQDNAAEIEIKADGCRVLDQYGEPYLEDRADYVNISTNSENGNVNFKCTLDEQPNDSGRAIVFNYDLLPRLCSTLGGKTDDWHQVITANGKTTLTCHLKTE